MRLTTDEPNTPSNGFSRTLAFPERPLAFSDRPLAFPDRPLCHTNALPFPRLHFRGLSELDLITHFLTRRDYPCPACAYNLRGLRFDTCPECGMDLHLAIRGQDDSAGPQLLRVLAMTLPLGFNAIFTMIGLVGAFFSRSWRADDWLMLSMFAALGFVFALMLRRVIRTAPRFRRRPRRDQWSNALRWSSATFIIQAAAIAMMFVMN